MSLFVFFISLLIVAQHVSGNHVPIIRSWRLRDVIASCWYVPWLQGGCQFWLAHWITMHGQPHIRFLRQAGWVTYYATWRYGLRRGSAAALCLWLRVRIPPGAWMFVSCECRVSSSRDLWVGLIIRPEESHRVWYIQSLLLRRPDGETTTQNRLEAPQEKQN